MPSAGVHAPFFGVAIVQMGSIWPCICLTHHSVAGPLDLPCWASASSAFRRIQSSFLRFANILYRPILDMRVLPIPSLLLIIFGVVGLVAVGGQKSILIKAVEQ